MLPHLVFVFIQSGNKSATTTPTPSAPYGNMTTTKPSTMTTAMMCPTRNITMRNIRIVSRNWCIGSDTFGGIYDIIFEESTIGDPTMVTSPWGIKVKSHQYYPGPMENITIRRIVIGKIGPTPWMYPTQTSRFAFTIGLKYHRSSEKQRQQRAGKPLFQNVTFEDITVLSSSSSTAAADRVVGQFRGLPEDCLQGLTLKNISVVNNDDDAGRPSKLNSTSNTNKWICNYIDLHSLVISNVHPPISCSGGCTTRTTTTMAVGGDALTE
mmetsp:Transcript_40706/g.45875  ORF Transcript_40706/g.45875 Transcript_40706/m.45875 type:complete len:267 (+) Transcript_40706:870-1670(+)